MPVSPALGAGHGRVAGYRLSARHGSNKHHARCGSGTAGAHRSRSHARRASFHERARAHHLGCRRHQRSHRPNRHNRRHAARHHRRGPAAAHSSACVDSNLTPSAQNLDRVRAATLCLVNRERTAQGESALREDAALACAAQSHSDDMASRGYFDHVGPGGDTPVSRVRRCGYIYSPQVGYEIGENIGWGTLWLATPRAMVAAWMSSPGHRANILDGRYRDTAIGISPHGIASLAKGQAGAVYTQDFGVISTG